MSDANSQSAQAKQRPGREAFGYLCPVDSRWADNDVYGHINLSLIHISEPTRPY